MHFTTIVIFPADDETLEKINQNLEKKAKSYPSETIRQSAALIPGTDLSKQDSVARALAELTGNESGVDEKGVYLMTTLFKDNLIAQCQKKMEPILKKLNFFDDYSVYALEMTEDLLINIETYDRFPDTILLPDLKLLRAPQAFMGIDIASANYPAFQKWQEEVKTVLKKYTKNSFSLILDCHI